MLEHLQIQNYQKHDRFRIKFDPRITAVIGPSDVGKSSVLRALHWLVANRPRGDAFIRTGSDMASVKVRVDGVDIKRKKGKQVNAYAVDGKVLEAFGSDVPESVQQAFWLDEVNFQGQHEAPFWFAETAGEVARRLNVIVDLELIDEVARRLGSRMRKAKAEVEVVGERLAEAEAEAEGLAYAEGMDADLAAVEEQEVHASRQAARVADLGRLVGEAVKCRQVAEWALEAKRAASVPLDQGSEAIGLRARADELGELVGRAKEMGEKAEVEIPDLDKLERLRGKASAARDRSDLLGGLVEDARDQRERRCRASTDLRDARKRLEREMGDVCPVCGKPWKT